MTFRSSGRDSRESGRPPEAGQEQGAQAVCGRRPWVEGEPSDCDGSAWDRLPPVVRAAA
jgi:hypothetical protein